MIICILQKGTMGTLLYLNSQEEQIILDHTAHTDHSQLKPEQGPMFLALLPGAVCRRPPRLCSCCGFSQIIRFTQTSRLCWHGPHTGTPDRAGCKKLEQEEPSASPFLELSTDVSRLHATETFHSPDVRRLSWIHRKGKITFLVNKLRNVNSVTSLKKPLSVLVTGKMWMQTDALVYC